MIWFGKGALNVVVAPQEEDTVRIPSSGGLSKVMSPVTVYVFDIASQVLAVAESELILHKISQLVVAVEFDALLNVISPWVFSKLVSSKI